MNQAAESLGSEMARARSSGENQQLAQTLERELSRQTGAAGPGGRAGPSSGSGAGSSARGEAGGTEAPAAAAAAGEAPPAPPRRPPAARRPARWRPVAELASAPDRPRGPAARVRYRDRWPAASGPVRSERCALPIGPGPSRAEVIEVAPGAGFTSPGYRRVYRDYEAAIEETLDATAVPPGRRRLVRRYFDLIHPR